MRRISLFTFLFLSILAANSAYAQEAATENSAAAAEAQSTDAEAATQADETDPAEEPAVDAKEPAELEPDENQKAIDEAADAEDAEDVEEGADGEGLAEEVGNDEADWAGILERFPAFFALTHHAAVHLPIALWLLGAFFVVIGLFAPSWRNQIPLACLIGGALSSVAAAASGWWYAHYEYGEEWAWADGLGDFDTKIVQHRWTGVTLVVASLILSVIALISQKKQSKGLGFIWRVGLLVLAAAVGWEGHIGGELVMGEGFLEEAIEAWLTGE